MSFFRNWQSTQTKEIPVNAIIQLLLRKAFGLARIRLEPGQVLEIRLEGGTYVFSSPGRNIPKLAELGDDVREIKDQIRTIDNIVQDIVAVCRDKVGQCQVTIGEIERRKRLEEKRAQSTKGNRF